MAQPLDLLVETYSPYYKYETVVDLENNYRNLHYDRTLITDKTLQFNRPHITLVDKRNREAAFIEN
jgi:hypothetical protein